MKPRLIIIAGPTAVGKSALAVKLAKQLDGEIISADSMQVYRGMDIGSAKIKSDETEGIPHYLIDELSPLEEFNIVRFQSLAAEYIRQITARGKLPIMVGGTGFYIQSVLYNVHFMETDSEVSFRKELQQKAETYGIAYLHEELSRIDPEAAAKIHPNNVKRVIRALEFHQLTGERISRHNEEEREREPAYNACYFVINDERSRIYSRIEQRIDMMLKDGLMNEVKTLMELGCTKDMVSMQGLGYKEILSYLNGECTLEEAIYILKRDTRHFAKRQLTWFKREKDVNWINLHDYAYSEKDIIHAMLSIIRERYAGYDLDRKNNIEL